VATPPKPVDYLGSVISNAENWMKRFGGVFNG
jgi:hypothetical protein